VKTFPTTSPLPSQPLLAPGSGTCFGGAVWRRPPCWAPRPFPKTTRATSAQPGTLPAFCTHCHPKGRLTMLQGRCPTHSWTQRQAGNCRWAGIGTLRTGIQRHRTDPLPSSNAYLLPFELPASLPATTAHFLTISGWRAGCLPPPSFANHTGRLRAGCGPGGAAGTVLPTLAHSRHACQHPSLMLPSTLHYYTQFTPPTPHTDTLPPLRAFQHFSGGTSLPSSEQQGQACRGDTLASRCPPACPFLLFALPPHALYAPPFLHRALPRAHHCHPALCKHLLPLRH